MCSANGDEIEDLINISTEQLMIENRLLQDEQLDLSESLRAGTNTNTDQQRLKFIEKRRQLLTNEIDRRLLNIQ